MFQNGPKQIASQPPPDSRPEVRRQSSTTDQSSPASLNGNLQSPTSLSSTTFKVTKKIKSSNREHPKPVNEIKNLNPESSDVLQRARSAINAAERASAAARAAAELVNASFKKEE